MLGNRWVDREKTLKQEIIRRLAPKLLKKDLASLGGTSMFLAVKAKEASLIPEPSIYLKKFEEAHKSQDLKKFSELFQHLSVCELQDDARFNGIDLGELSYISEDVNGVNIDLKACGAYINQSDHSMAVSISHPKGQRILSTAALDPSKTFPIHSVGKVFTGVLMLKMLEEDFIKEKDLDEPPKLDEDVIKKLPPAVRERLKTKEGTLKHLMLHTSGIGDYLLHNSDEPPSYMKVLKHEVDLAKQGSRRVKPPMINSPIDFLAFAENELYPLEPDPAFGRKMHYSNLGILLVGMAIEHAYNNDPRRKDKPKLTYDQILFEHVIKPSGLTSFSNKNPGDGITNPRDPVAPYIEASPAGGYWLTVGDLGKFGQWLITQEKEDETFRKLLKEYGHEFYDPKGNVLAHGGDIPSASAQLTCYLNTGTVVCVLSNRPQQARNFISELQDHHARDSRERKLAVHEELSAPSKREEPIAPPAGPVAPIPSQQQQPQGRVQGLVNQYEQYIKDKEQDKPKEVSSPSVNKRSRG